MFSLFDSILQNELSCRNGFKEVKNILIQKRKIELHNRFDYFICAINVLKDGGGRSYDALVAMSESIPFMIKLSDDNFFNEGDVSEVSTLIELDEKFVLNCAKMIERVPKCIRNESTGIKHPFVPICKRCVS